MIFCKKRDGFQIIKSVKFNFHYPVFYSLYRQYSSVIFLVFTLSAVRTVLFFVVPLFCRSSSSASTPGSINVRWSVTDAQSAFFSLSLSLSLSLSPPLLLDLRSSLKYSKYTSQRLNAACTLFKCHRSSTVIRELIRIFLEIKFHRNRIEPSRTNLLESKRGTKGKCCKHPRGLLLRFTLKFFISRVRTDGKTVSLHSLNDRLR